MIIAWKALNFATQTKVKAQLTSFDSSAKILKTHL